MTIDILTIFPEMFGGPLDHSIVGKAREAGLVRIQLHNLRDYAEDKHQTVDDAPYGGGGGMVFRPEPLAKALRALIAGESKPRTIFLTPEGKPFTQRIANHLSLDPRIVLICGHYRGIDERIRERYVTDEISVGDYVLSGGELPAMVLVDAIVRLIPGAIGNFESAQFDSFQDRLLDCPWYTRPRVFEGMSVPEVLLRGNHADVSRWRRLSALCRTADRRPDILDREALSDSEVQFLRTRSHQP